MFIVSLITTFVNEFQKGAAYGCPKFFSPPLKTFGFCCAKPKKKSAGCAQISRKVRFWWNFTTPLEPILAQNANSLSRAVCPAKLDAPHQKPLCIFFEISPAVIYWIWKRVFLVIRLPQAVEAARLQSAKPTRYAPSVYAKWFLPSEKPLN